MPTDNAFDAAIQSAAPPPLIIALDIDGAAAATGLSVNTIRRATAAGALRCSRIGKSVRYPITELQRWLEACMVVPAVDGGQSTALKETSA